MPCIENHPKDETTCAGFYFVGFKETLSISCINQNINNPCAMLFFVVATTNTQHLFLASKPSRKAPTSLHRSGVGTEVFRSDWAMWSFLTPEMSTYCHSSSILIPEEGHASATYVHSKALQNKAKNSGTADCQKAFKQKCVNKLFYVTNGDNGGTHGPC